MPRELRVAFENCRNIKCVAGGYLPLYYNHLNVLFGRNGTGKSTISRVLNAWNNPDDQAFIQQLESFLYLQTENQSEAPKIDLPESRTRNVLIFNNEWVDNHCFYDDGNLQSGAYSLYVSSPEVRRLENNKDSLLQSLRKTFFSDEVEELRKAADDVAKGVGSTARGKVGNTFKDNAPLEGLPRCLSGMVREMGGEHTASWLGWHVQGGQYAAYTRGRCPYCGQDAYNIQRLVEFDSKHVVKQGDSWLSAVRVFANGNLFGLRVNKRALKLMGGRHRLTSDDMQWLVGLAKRAKILVDCIDQMRTVVSSYADNSSDAFFDKLNRAYDVFNNMSGYSNITKSVMRIAITSIKLTLKNEKRIRESVAALQSKAAENASKYKNEIDLMLTRCGYPYKIEIHNNCSGRESRVLLVPHELGAPLSGQVRGNLSYGEQNMLALILFMFQAIDTRGSQIIVLDDPISSFDGDKRCAILYRMFHRYKRDEDGGGHKSLADRTVVLLTHDYLVVSDIANLAGKIASEMLV